MISQIISVAFGIVLARMLSPDDFGLIASMVVFTGFASLLMDVGLGSALVQKKDIAEIHYNTVFWTNLGLGISLTVSVALCSPLIASFYERQELVGIGYVLSLQFVLGALALVPRQRLVKDLSFKVIAPADLIGMVVSGAIAIFMVQINYGYWALAWQPVTLRLVATLYIWIVAKWLPSIAFSKDALKELFGFSFFVFASSILMYASRQVDKILVGKLIGAEALGILDKAESMLLFPLQNVSNVVGSVMFPALSEIQDEKDRVKAVFLKSTQSIALLTFPMMAGMFAVSENFVFGVLGEQWQEMIPIFQTLTFVGIATSIVAVNGPIFLSQGKAKLQFKVKLITRPIAIIAAIVGINWGIQGIAIAIALSGWINGMIALKVSGSLIDLPLCSLLRSLFKAFICAFIMAVCLVAADPLLTKFSSLGQLLIQIPLGAIIYLLLLLMVRPPAALELLTLIKYRIYKHSRS